MAPLPPNIHTQVPGRGCTQSVLKGMVKVNGHVIRALLSCHKNQLFSRTNCSIITELAHNVPQAGLHPECAQGQGRGQRSRDTGTFVLARKSHTMVSRWVCIQHVYSTSPRHPTPGNGSTPSLRAQDFPSGYSVTFLSHFGGRRPLAFGGDCVESVSYTHLTLPTNREV